MKKYSHAFCLKNSSFFEIAEFRVKFKNNWTQMMCFVFAIFVQTYVTHEKYFTKYLTGHRDHCNYVLVFGLLYVS